MVAQLNQKEKQLDKRLHGLSLNGTTVQGALISFLTENSTQNSLKLVDFNAPHVSEKDGQEIETFLFTLEGSYTAILKMINALENKGSFGGVCHVQFQKHKKRKTKKTYLQARANALKKSNFNYCKFSGLKY